MIQMRAGRSLKIVGTNIIGGHNLLPLVAIGQGGLVKTSFTRDNVVSAKKLKGKNTHVPICSGAPNISGRGGGGQRNLDLNNIELSIPMIHE